MCPLVAYARILMCHSVRSARYTITKVYSSRRYYIQTTNKLSRHTCVKNSKHGRKQACFLIAAERFNLSTISYALTN